MTMQLTKSDLLPLLKQLEAIAAETLNDLEELARQYPYFQAVHTLIAKAKHDQQTPDAEAALHRAAIYAPDRRHLRKIILEEVHRSPSEAPSTDEAAPPPVEAPAVGKDLEPVDAPMAGAVEPSEPATEENLEPVDTPVVPPEVSEPATEEDTEPVEEPVASFEASEPVVTEENEPEATIDTVKNEPETIVVAEDHDPEPTIAEEEAPSVAEPVIATEPTTTDEADERESVYDALEKNLKNLQEVRSAQRTEDQKPLASGTTQREQQELMDKFVSQEHDKLNTPMDLEATIADLAEKSTLAPEELVTENLAEIFIKQGKVEKGLALYEKLSLKFPEKKAYFADKIEQLKK